MKPFKSRLTRCRRTERRVESAANGDRQCSSSEFVYERIANLDIIVEGDQCRLYTKVVENIPRGNTRYHIVYVFYIDATHDYPHSALATYSRAAQSRMEEATALETISDVEQYLADHDALGPDDLREMLSEEDCG